MIPSRPSWSIQHILYLGEDILGLLIIEEAIQVSTAISVDQLNKQSNKKKQRKINKEILKQTINKHSNTFSRGKLGR